MGQAITVTVRAGVRSDVKHFELNRSLTGMQTHRYTEAVPVTGTKPPDELARRLFALGVSAVTLYSSVVRVVEADARLGRGDADRRRRAPGLAAGRAGQDRAGRGDHEGDPGRHPQRPHHALVADPLGRHGVQAWTRRMAATPTRMEASARRMTDEWTADCSRAPSWPPTRLPAMTGPAWARLIRPWAANTSRAAADVIPTVKVVVEAATFTGTRMI